VASGSSNIEGEGIAKFYDAIQVDPMDPLTLYISMQKKADGFSVDRRRGESRPCDTGAE